MPKHWPEEGGVQVAGVVVALDAFLFPHHDIQAIILSAGRSVFMHHLTQVASERCRNQQHQVS